MLSLVVVPVLDGEEGAGRGEKPAARWGHPGPEEYCVDCAIELVEGVPLPKGHLFSLYKLEEEAMETYVCEVLAQSIIWP